MQVGLHGFGSVRFVLNHPLNADQRFRALLQYSTWQLVRRLVTGPVMVDFVNDSVLLVRSGDYASFVIFTGLFECEEMGFVLHCLRKGDLFVDVGANVGAFAVLASGVVGARSIAFEPVKSTFADLQHNVLINHADGLIKLYNAGVGGEDGMAAFTTEFGARNRVVPSNDDRSLKTENIPIRRLDGTLAGENPTVLKIDVEGFETEVIRGADRVLSQEGLLAVIMELNTGGSRYGYDDTALHRTVLDYGFESCMYRPLERELIPLRGKMNEQSLNTIYVRRMDEVTERLRAAPRFFVKSKRLWV